METREQYYPIAPQEQQVLVSKNFATKTMQFVTFDFGWLKNCHSISHYSLVTIDFGCQNLHFFMPNRSNGVWHCLDSTSFLWKNNFLSEIRCRIMHASGTFFVANLYFVKKYLANVDCKCSNVKLCLDDTNIWYHKIKCRNLKARSSIRCENG